jgi:hypothetical protein
MSHSHFNSADEGTPCCACEHYGGPDSSGCYAVCLRYAPGIQIQISPQYGCAHWVRAIGADDEDDKQRATGWNK